MQFVSLGFLLLLPLAAFINYLIPRKYRYIWLLVTSIFFYLGIDLKASAVMAGTVVVTYFAALFIERLSENSGKRAVGSRIVFVLAVVIEVASMLIFRSGKILGAVGISFYMLKSVGYLVDVYRGDEKAEKNFALMALFVSFFPQVVSGPIERMGNMRSQFAYPVNVDFDRLRDGFLQMLWGYFLKLVLADRIAMFVNTVYAAPESAEGTVVLVAAILYSFEIYCDFAGYSAIAIGAARIMGIDVMKNFDTPYLSKTVAEFWRRWHISLSSWFRDYVYIPLGGNRVGVARKYINVLIVFGLSGLWHGTALTFLIWGLLYAVFMVIGYATIPVRDKMTEALRIDREGLSHRTGKVILTFAFITFAWVFFRASSVTQALVIIRKCFEFTPWVLTDGTLFQYGLTQGGFNVSVAGIILLIVADVISYRGIEIRSRIIGQSIWYRWLIMIGAILTILIFGTWGAGYDATDFIYQQF